MLRSSLILLCLIVSAGACPLAPEAADPGIADDEYAVYSALLSPERPQADAGKEDLRLAEASRKKRPHLAALGGDVLPVRRQTRSPEMLDKKQIETVESSYLVGPDVKLDGELIDDFNAKNAKSHELSSRFTFTGLVVLLSQDEWTSMFNAGGWEELYRRYPGARGILTLSRVGFNAKRDRAFLYAGSASGPRSGAGYFVLLEKSKASGTWYIVKHIPLWIS
jgi:hypothetical protein